MRHAATLAKFICGDAACARVFEPLLADWQRELQHAAGPISRTAAVLSGSFAFMRALAVCFVIDGAWTPPLRATLTSLAAITVAVAISIGVLLMAPLPQNLPLDVSEPVVQRWILIWANILVPPAFLLATFLLRRDTRASRRHAIVFTMLAATATTAIVINTTDDALRRRYDTFEVHERMRELALERHRAGSFVFSGRRYEETMRTTVEERRASFDRYRASIDRIVATLPAPTWSDELTQFRPVMLAVIFAVMGWTLAGLGRATVPRAFGWWALVFMATITLTRIFWLVVQVPMPRTPQWLMPTLFVFVAVALGVNAIRSRRSMRSI